MFLSRKDKQLRLRNNNALQFIKFMLYVLCFQHTVTIYFKIVKVLEFDWNTGQTTLISINYCQYDSVILCLKEYLKMKPIVSQFYCNIFIRLQPIAQFRHKRHFHVYWEIHKSIHKLYSRVRAHCFV